MASKSINVKDYRTEVPGGLDEPKTAWVFPTVEGVNSNSKTMYWTVSVKVFRMVGGVPVFIPIEEDFFNSKVSIDAFAQISVDSKIAGGKVRDAVPTVVRAGKNLGKASSTNALTQALRDAYGLYNKQLKKHTRDETRFPPMLAQVLKDQKKPIDIAAGVYVQRKYDGVRAVSTIEGDELIMYSRRGNLYPGFDYIKGELKAALAPYYAAGRKVYLDGEIYKHGVMLQDISGQARRDSTADDIICDYMIYDCFIPSEPELIYADRKTLLDEIFAAAGFTHAENVETFAVNTEAELVELYEAFLEEGYEGAMVRVNAPYAYSYNEHHSKVLLKMKPTRDAEFTMIGWETGEKGKAAQALMAICQTDAGKAFPVTPAMELPDRIALAKKMVEIEPNGKTHFENHWQGRKLIVYYDEMSKDLVPQRARTKMELRTWD